MVMRIREWREGAGLSQKELAMRMGVVPGAVSNWESELALPKARDLPLLARVLGCSIDDLFVSIEDCYPIPRPLFRPVFDLSMREKSPFLELIFPIFGCQKARKKPLNRCSSRAFLWSR